MMTHQGFYSERKSDNDTVDNIMSLKLGLANALTDCDHVKQVASATMIENKELHLKLEELTKRCAELQDKNIGLTKVVHHLQSNAKATSKEKYELRAQMEAYQVQRDRYKARIDPLKEENARLKGEREQLMSGVVTMRIELERERGRSKNSFATEVVTHSDCHASDSSLNMNGEESRRKSFGNHEVSKNQCSRHEKIEYNILKTSAMSLKRWSQETFGRRHSALQTFFDDDILDCNLDDCSSACSTVDSEDHLSTQDMPKLDNHAWKRPDGLGFASKRRRERFSITRFVEDIQHRLGSETDQD